MYGFIRNLLQKYDKVFLVTRLFPQKKWDCFCSVFSRLISQASGAFFLLEEGMDCPQKFNSVVISHQEAEDLYKLYLTYEFSDRFVAFADLNQYGSLFHYIETGILTEEEAVRVIINQNREENSATNCCRREKKEQ